MPEVKPDRSPSYFATPKRSDVLPVNPEPRNQAIDAMPVPPSAASSAPSLPEFPSPISPSAPATGYPPASDLNTPAQMPKTLPAIEPPIVSQ
ncbi:MAG: hypothetical protein HC772_11905 [Leptolyngbyaceae cyanobacterium CRU_2_3]|nr:hypothetical protein [Leptolyngbyaceae cyanobacterium CRU_2_3]